MDRMTTPVCRRKSQLSIDIAQLIHLNHHDVVDQRQLYGMAGNLQRQLTMHMLLKLLCFNAQRTAGSTTLESFTGVIGRAGLGQGRGVLSRVTSACMLFLGAVRCS